MKLRFIKDWGPYKAGSYKITDMETTRKFLVEVHKVAEVVPDVPLPTSFGDYSKGNQPSVGHISFDWPKPKPTEEAPDPMPDETPVPISDTPKPNETLYLRSPKRDKMLRGPRKAKAETPPPEAGENE